MLVVHNGCAPDHSQFLRVEIARLGNHLFGEPVAEVILPPVSGKVLEWENSKRQSSRCRLAKAFLNTSPIKATGGNHQSNHSPRRPNRPSPGFRLAGRGFE